MLYYDLCAYSYYLILFYTFLHYEFRIEELCLLIKENEYVTNTRIYGIMWIDYVILCVHIVRAILLGIKGTVHCYATSLLSISPPPYHRCHKGLWFFHICICSDNRIGWRRLFVVGYFPALPRIQYPPVYITLDDLTIPNFQKWNTNGIQ